MKTKLTTLLTVILFVLSACGQQTTSGFPKSDLIDSQDAEQPVPEENTGIKVSPIKLPAIISGARALAENLMRKAAQKSKGEEQSHLFQEMQQALATAKIHLPSPGHDLKVCRDEADVLAYVNLRTPHTIHVCRRAQNGNMKQLAQILTHETAHVVGVHNECSATKVEVAVMRLSGADLGFRNGYMDPCGIK